MADVNDPGNREGQYKTQFELLEAADITESDRTAIRDFVNNQELYTDNSVTTLLSKVKLLRIAAERSEKPLTDMNKSEVDQFLLSLTRGTNPHVSDDGISESYARNYRQKLRLFYEYLEREWYDDIKVGAPPKTKVSEEDILSEEEATSLLEAAPPREEAMLAVLLATGQRISALLSVQLKEVDTEGPNGSIKLNEEAIGRKGASGPRPLLWATPYVRNWIHHSHPKKRDSEAPLFCAKRDYGDKTEAGDALNPGTAYTALERTADKAGISKSRVHPHIFRHTAITRMVRDGMDEQKIKFMVGWKPDSGQLERYSHVKDEQMVNDIQAFYGDGETTSDKGGKPKMENCPNCHVPLSDFADPVACPGCGMSLTGKAEAVESQIEEAMYESKGEVESETVESGIDTAREIIENDPEAKKAILEDLLAEYQDNAASADD